MWETQVWSLGQEDPLEKGMATHSSILASRIPWTEEPGKPQSVGRKESTEWLTYSSWSWSWVQSQIYLFIFLPSFRFFFPSFHFLSLSTPAFICCSPGRQQCALNLTVYHSDYQDPALLLWSHFCQKQYKLRCLHTCNNFISHWLHNLLVLPGRK